MNRIADNYVEVKVDGVLRRRNYTVGSDSKGMVQIEPEISRGFERVIRYQDGTFEIITIEGIKNAGAVSEEIVD